MTDRESADKAVRRARKDYQRLLDAFEADSKSNAECVAYLLTLGYTHGQARNALYRYRTRLKPA